MKNALISAVFGGIMGALVCALAIGVGPIPWIAGKIAGPADASQNALSSPTVGTVSGLQLSNNYNNALDSLNTMNSGTSAPTNQLSGVPSAFNRWCNTTSNPYPCNIYDGAQWLAPMWVDATNHLVINQIGGGLPATIASAATVDLCSTTSSRISISGNTTVNSFGSTCPVGIYKTIIFQGALTLTYNASSMILPGAASITTSASDQAIVYQFSAGNWIVVAYTPFSGQALLNPSIDVGAVEWTFSATIPAGGKYLYGFGQAVSRATYASLMTAFTVVQSVTATNGSPTLTGFSDTTQICQNTAVFEATYLPANATVQSCTSTTVTLNKNATASTTGNVTVFLYGDGDGSTTFNLPDCRGAVFAGRDNMGGTPKGALTTTYFTHNPDSLGATGGTQSQTIAQANLPNVNFTNSGIALNDPGHNHSTNVHGSNSNSANPSNTFPGIVAGFGGGNGTIYSTTSDGTSHFGATFIANATTGITISNQGSAASGGSGTAIPLIQPTITANCMIRVLAFLSPVRGVPAPEAANENQFAAIEPRRLAS